MHERECRAAEGACPDTARRVLAPEPPLLSLQRAAGNRAVAAVIRRIELERGTPGERPEHAPGGEAVLAFEAVLSRPPLHVAMERYPARATMDARSPQPRRGAIEWSREANGVAVVPGDAQRAAQRYEITLEPPEGPFSAASLQTIRAQLTAWGIADPGDLTTVNRAVSMGRTGAMPRLDATTIRRAMQTLEALRTMGSARTGTAARPGRGGRAGYPGRVVAAWNERKDDLGPGARYPTILHYVAHLDELAQSSLGMHYLDALRSPSAFASVRLAGLGGEAIQVHPRAVYFAAAAQVGMDIRAGRAQGEGHYVAPGAFVPELIAIFGRAQSLGTPPRPGRRGRPAAPNPEVEQLGVQAFNAMRTQVLRILEVLEVQAGTRTVPGIEASEHPEPALQRFLVPKAADLRALPRAGTADEARELARRLATLLQGIRGVPRSHGGWAIDPHGTMHAMGLAIDLFNGRGGAGVYQNFGVPREYWPFVHMVLEQPGVEASVRGLRPTAVHELEPEQARAIAAALRAPISSSDSRPRAVALAAQLAEGPARESPRVVRERRAVLSTYRQLAGRALSGCYRRWQALTIALSRRRWFAHAPEVRLQAGTVSAALAARVRSRATFLDQPPARLREWLAGTNGQLTALADAGAAATRTAREQALASAGGERGRRASARRLDTDQAVLEGARPTAAIGRATLEGLHASLGEGVEATIAAFVEERQAAARAIVRSRGFRAWLDRVTSSATPLYTQPSTMVGGLDAVLSHEPVSWTSTRFFGGHHWEIAPEAILSSPDAYVAALRRDMSSRERRSSIDRVLAIMAESPGGRSILASRERLFMQALAGVYPNAEALVTAALGPEGATPRSGPLATFLRERGFRYLAGDEAGD